MPISINGTTGISGVNGSAAAPAIVGGDSDTGIFFGTDTASIATGGTSRLHVDSSGQIGVNTTSPAALLHVVPTAVDTDIFAIRRQDSSTTNLFRFFQDSSITGGAGGAHINTVNRPLAITASNTGNPDDGLFIDTQGRVMVGLTTTQDVGGSEGTLNTFGTTYDNSTITALRIAGDNNGATLVLGKARGSLATPAVPDDDDELGKVTFFPYDGVDYTSEAVRLGVFCDGAVSEDTIPARFEIRTNGGQGATAAATRVVVTSDGGIQYPANYNLIKRGYSGEGPGSGSTTIYHKTRMFPCASISSTGTASRTFNVFNYDNNNGVIITIFGKHNNQSPRICDRSVFVCGNYSSGTITQLPGLGWSSNSACSVSYSASGGVLSCTVTTTTAAGPVWISMHVETLGPAGSIYKNADSADGQLT